MPRARIFPSLISATELPIAPHTIGTWPPSSDCVIGPPPANGTVTKSTLKSNLSCSIESDGVVPVTSALVNAQSTSDNTLPRVHSIGVVEEGFGPPHLQQGPWIGFGDPVSKVLTLLNTNYTNGVFRTDLP